MDFCNGSGSCVASPKPNGYGVDDPVNGCDGTVCMGGVEVWDPNVACWNDTAKSLQWQLDTGDIPYLTVPDAAAYYCDWLDLGGHTDWRLPTLNELRSGIQGCAGTVTGGTCTTTSTCPSCTHTSCSGCTSGAGPGFMGSYFRSPASSLSCFPGTPPISSTTVTVGSQPYYLYVDFCTGAVGAVAATSSNYTRPICVRSNP